MLRRLALGIVLLSSIAYGQDYELYSGISMHEHEDIKYGYVVGANFIIKTKQDREYFNNIIFGFEHAGYQNLDVYDGEIFSEYRVNHINAGVKKFIKTKHWIWSPTIMFNPNVVSFSIGVSYK